MAADVLPTVAGDIRALAGDGFLAPFGFTSTEDADALEFGRPYGVFTIHKGPWFEFMGYWKAPILVHGEYRSMVKVRREEEGYLMGELGAASLAAQLAESEKVPALSAALDVGRARVHLGRHRCAASRRVVGCARDLRYGDRESSRNSIFIREPFFPKVTLRGHDQQTIARIGFRFSHSRGL